MSTRGSDRPLRADAQRNRQALLAKAREIFESGEFFDLRFDDFARLAGVGTGTLYRHFPTREALAEAVYHEEVVALCDRAHRLRETSPALEALSTFLREFVGYVHEHHGLARTLTTLMATGSETLAEGSRALEEAVTGLVTAAAEEGTVRGDVGAGAVMMALHGIGAAHERPEWRAEADGVITLVLDGLVQRAQPSSPNDSPAR
ncbi:TetR/AcrR family transcriptional regulator [Lentzea flaviverrucosa]|uniref:Transcriptional regulator, TetR family n=1 Tax=Lentzea flaviverrucosa TaxID=200379 RepID=A0A1H9JQZ1_9PSEU|nr:TetR/AcrR family transcriptional regulator [Lentzea flaviverrucosa]RDI26601.1 TetR family transcriptional regulator [Lentzea flaviverrucosa]SEQ89252.1 transcriptional regulator, TetR family [Lentzea flaviverrucosa]